jgi:hypothetical protein
MPMVPDPALEWLAIRTGPDFPSIPERDPPSVRTRVDAPALGRMVLLLDVANITTGRLDRVVLGRFARMDREPRTGRATTADPALGQGDFLKVVETRAEDPLGNFARMDLGPRTVRARIVDLADTPPVVATRAKARLDQMALDSSVRMGLGLRIDRAMIGDPVHARTARDHRAVEGPALHPARNCRVDG